MAKKKSENSPTSRVGADLFFVCRIRMCSTRWWVVARGNPNQMWVPSGLAGLLNRFRCPTRLFHFAACLIRDTVYFDTAWSNSASCERCKYSWIPAMVSYSARIQLVVHWKQMPKIPNGPCSFLNMALNPHLTHLKSAPTARLLTLSQKHFWNTFFRYFSASILQCKSFYHSLRKVFQNIAQNNLFIENLELSPRKKTPKNVRILKGTSEEQSCWPHHAGHRNIHTAVSSWLSVHINKQK